MLDWNRIHELQNEVGEDEFKLILELFLDEVEGVMMRLSKRDAVKLADDLHFLRGCARNLGFRAFADICGTGELDAGQGRAAQFDVAAMMGCYSESKQQLIRTLEDAARSQDARRA